MQALTCKLCRKYDELAGQEPQKSTFQMFEKTKQENKNSHPFIGIAHKCQKTTVPVRLASSETSQQTLEL